MDMGEQVHWMLELDIRDGQFDAFTSLMSEMVDATQASEPGTLNYEWFVSDDRKRCHIYERYTDSAAALVHMAAFGAQFAKRFMATLQPTRIVVYGPADEALTKALSPLAPAYMAELGGFTR
jgi:quinol monooxygenase YgiN